MNPRSRNERPRIVDGPTERVSPLSANTSRTRSSIGSSGNRKQQERRRRGEARLRRPGSGSFVVTAVSPRRDGALLDARASGTPGKQVGTRAGRHSAVSTERERKRTREVPVRLSPPPVASGATAPSPGPCIHFHWHQRAAGLVGRRCPACATWRHAGARGW